MSLKLPILTPDQKKILKIIELCEIGPRNIAQEIEADRKALEIYLEMGNSKADAIKAFEKVLNKGTEANNKRYEALKKNIDNHESRKI